MPVKQRTWQTLGETKLVKAVKIIVWINKDFKLPGQEVTFHPKYLKSWNAALDFLTFALKPRFGAVRKLYHLDTRKPVLNLEDIKTNDKYVAVGSDKLKFPKNGYLTEQELNKINRPVTNVISHAPQSVENVGSDLNFLACTKKNKRTVVYFMVSGRSCQSPLKVVLIERDFMDDAILLEYLGYRLDVGEGIQYICTIHGKIVPKFTDLKHGNLYIVVSHSGRFVRLDYPKLFAELQPSKTIELTHPTKQKSDHKKNFQRKRTSWQTNKKSGTLGSLEAKCIGVTCVDADCRRARNESVSQATSIEDIPVYDEARIKANEVCGKLEYQLAANWGEYTANLRKTVSKVVGEVDMIRNTLDDILDRTIVEVEERGIVTPNFIKSGVEDVSTKTSLGKNLTTFAEIARQKEWLEEAETIFAFDSLPRSNPLDGSDNPVPLCSSSKKSVSFSQYNRPETIFESREAPSAIELNKPVRTSILKVHKCDDSLEVLLKPDQKGAVLNDSFLKLPDSVTEVTNAPSAIEPNKLVRTSILKVHECDGSLEVLLKPDKKGPVLNESFLKLPDSVTEVTNAPCAIEQNKLVRTSILKNDKCDDSLEVLPKPDKKCPVPNESFVKLPDSVIEVTNAPSAIEPNKLVRTSIPKVHKYDDSLEVLPKPDKKGPVLNESFLKLPDSVTEVTNAPCVIEPNKLVRTSILKNHKYDDSLKVFPKPDKKDSIHKETFLKSRDSVTEVTNAPSAIEPNKLVRTSILKNRKCDDSLEVLPKPEEKGPVLHESFLNSRDVTEDVTEVTNAVSGFSAEEPCVHERDSLEDIKKASIFYPLEGKRSMSDLLLQCRYDCKGVQKDWKLDEDIMNKGIQVQEPTNRDSQRLLSLAQLYNNVAEDDVSTRFSCVIGLSDGTRQSLAEPICRREDSHTLACSDICLYKCSGEGICSDKC